jgi:hypothetical protein
MTPDEENKLREIQVTAKRIYPGRDWNQLTPDEQNAVFRAYEAERGYAAGLVNTPTPQGKTVGPYNIYVAPNWGEMAHYAVAQGLGGYLLGKANQREAMGRKALSDLRDWLQAILARGNYQ